MGRWSRITGWESLHARMFAAKRLTAANIDARGNVILTPSTNGNVQGIRIGYGIVCAERLHARSLDNPAKTRFLTVTRFVDGH